jgi:hypothetical protein
MPERESLSRSMDFQSTDIHSRFISSFEFYVVPLTSAWFLCSIMYQ